MTMLANSLSHTILLGIVLAFLLFHKTASGMIGMEILLAASLITAILTTFLTQFLTQVMKLQEDASIGLVFSTLFALGIVLVTIFTRNVHIGIEVVTGNIDALHFDDLKMVFYIALFNCATYFLFSKQFKIIAFDSPFASSLGIAVHFFNYLLMVQVSATMIGAFRAVGVLLILALITGPVLTARRLTDRLFPMIVISAMITACASIISVALSRHLVSKYHLPLSTAGIMVMVVAVIYVLVLLFSPKRGIIARLIFNKIALKKEPLPEIESLF